MKNLKILSVALVIMIGNILFMGCEIYNKYGENKINIRNNNQEGLSIYEYNDIFTNLYKKYIDPIEKEEYDDIKKFLLKQDNEDNYKSLNKYKKLLNISNQQLIEFKKGMNNLVTKDIDLTKLNNELIENTLNLIKEIEVEIKEIDNIPPDNYSMAKSEFIVYLQKNISIQSYIKTKFENSIESIRNYLDIELNK
ncbi:MAG: hypothetical protein E7C86_07305 [Paeniclostridium sordellii]|uniref:Lipoprotein n=1 Tax=Paeniclostridium hominis TaxID=2764329 RepID=A0ABR7K3N7_9FIRM|nr:MULTISPECIES: hypothetical protein [Paeniclostridium]MBC6003715.1 hypothetical protein [Paeniclostridium hominis]MBC8631930.1 hypothetical protein [[Eubacterium] tenue]MDU2592409.1 hypothetical protein [Paeniclostridium sordellii]